MRLAVVGCGRQGATLLREVMTFDGVSISALCDIRGELVTGPMSHLLRRGGHLATEWDDLTGMLKSAPDLDAVLIATPDRCHAEQAMACLQAGLHVYLEPPLARSMEEMHAVTKASQTARRLVQVGYQRRSDPRYRHAIERILSAEVLGRVTQATSQWHMVEADGGRDHRNHMDPEHLARAGYRSYDELLAWWRHRRHTGGIFLSQASHQLDLLCWLHGRPPESVMAAAGQEVALTGDAWDTGWASYGFRGEGGCDRLRQQIATWCTAGGVRESFLGINGSIDISEIGFRSDRVERELTGHYDNSHLAGPDWNNLVKSGVLDYAMSEQEINALWDRQRNDKQITVRSDGLRDDYGVIVDVTSGPLRFKLPVSVGKSHPCRPHLVNFLDAIRGNAVLNCSIMDATPATVGALAAGTSVATGCRQSIHLHDALY